MCSITFITFIYLIFLNFFVEGGDGGLGGEKTLQFCHCVLGVVFTEFSVCYKEDDNLVLWVVMITVIPNLQYSIVFCVTTFAQ